MKQESTRSRKPKRNLWKRMADRGGMPANPFLGVVLCCVVCGVSGMLAVHLSNPDQGRVVTVQEAGRMSEVNRQRILNNPHMPPQAKAAALRMLGYPDKVGPFLRKRYAQPSPNPKQS